MKESFGCLTILVFLSGIGAAIYLFFFKIGLDFTDSAGFGFAVAISFVACMIIHFVCSAFTENEEDTMIATMWVSSLVVWLAVITLPNNSDDEQSSLMDHCPYVETFLA